MIPKKKEKKEKQTKLENYKGGLGEKKAKLETQKYDLIK